MYDRIDGLRKHDIVVGEVVVRGGGLNALFGIPLTASACGNFEGILPARAMVFVSYQLFWSYYIYVCTATACPCHQTAAVIPVKQFYYPAISGYLFTTTTILILLCRPNIGQSH